MIRQDNADIHTMWTTIVICQPFKIALYFCMFLFVFFSFNQAALICSLDQMYLFICFENLT